MSANVTLARTTKRQLCNGRQVISRFAGWGFLCVQLRGSVWNFSVHECVACAAPVYNLQGNEFWSGSVTREDCAACASWTMWLHLLRPHSVQLIVRIKHIYIRIKMELETRKRFNMHNVSASVISRCLIVTASGLMGQNRPVKR